MRGSTRGQRESMTRDVFREDLEHDRHRSRNQRRVGLVLSLRNLAALTTGFPERSSSTQASSYRKRYWPERPASVNAPLHKPPPPPQMRLPDPVPEYQTERTICKLQHLSVALDILSFHASTRIVAYKIYAEAARDALSKPSTERQMLTFDDVSNQRPPPSRPRPHRPRRSCSRLRRR